MAGVDKQERETWLRQQLTVMHCPAVHEGSKEAAAPKEETPAPVAAVKDNLPKPDDNPLAGLFSSCEQLLLSPPL